MSVTNRNNKRAMQALNKLTASLLIKRARRRFHNVSALSDSQPLRLENHEEIMQARDENMQAFDEVWERVKHL